jgi:hypothetical protein
MTLASIRTAYKLALDINWLCCRLLNGRGYTSWLGSDFGVIDKYYADYRKSRHKGRTTLIPASVRQEAHAEAYLTRGKALLKLWKDPANRSSQYAAVVEEHNAKNSKKAGSKKAKVFVLPPSFVNTACDTQRRIAQQQWPTGIPLTVETAKTAARLMLNADWTAFRLLNLDAYQRNLTARRKLANKHYDGRVTGAEYHTKCWMSVIRAWKQPENRKPDLVYQTLAA